jgi:hypothetical protein
MKKKTYTHTWQKYLSVLVIVITIVIGYKAIDSSFASTSSASSDASSGTLNTTSIPGCAADVADRTAASGSSVSFDLSSNPPPTSPPPNAFTVTDNTYAGGADPTGTRDSTLAIRAAIEASEAASMNTTPATPETLYFPAGHYILDDNDGVQDDLVLDGKTGAVVNVLGAGQNTTKITEEIGYQTPGNLTQYTNRDGTTVPRGKDIFLFKGMNGMYFSGLTLDSASFNAGDTLNLYGSCDTVENSTFLGAYSDGLNNNPNVFDMRFDGGPCSSDPTASNYVDTPGYYHYGNIARNLTLLGQGSAGDDDLDLSCQKDDYISNITDTGFGTVLYYTQNMTIDGYNYTPGNELSPPGWDINDSSNVTINNFTTSGPGGQVKNGDYPSSNITLTNETMTTPGFNINIGDVTNMNINDSHLQTIRLSPEGTTTSANGEEAGINGLVFTKSTGTLQCSPSNGSVINGLVGIGPCP